MLRIVSLFIVFAFITACGPKKPPPKDLCSTGVDTQGCTLDVRNHSVWQQHYLIANGDQAKVSRHLHVYYEFQPDSRGTSWRRLISVTGPSTKRSMYQDGLLANVSPGQMQLFVNGSSCDFEPTRKLETIYFTRTGNSLYLNAVPTADVYSPSPISEVMKSMNQGFSFASARRLLESNDGEFNGIQLMDRNPGEVGCFTNMGSGFSPSRNQSLGW